MSFERNQDPKDSIGIGRKKDALPLVRIDYYTNSYQATIDNPEIIKNFLDQFCSLPNTIFPPNPIFGPQRIEFTIKEKYLDYADNFASSMVSRMAALSGNTVPPQEPRDLVEKEREIKANIFEFEGRTVLYDGKMYAMPTLKELDRNGYGYLEKCQKFYESEKVKMDKAKHLEQLSQMQNLKRYVSADVENYRNMADIRLQIARLGISDEEQKENEENQRSEWKPFIIDHMNRLT